jgi:hypothetical protein
MSDSDKPVAQPDPMTASGPACAWLGLEDDPATHYSFPSGANECHTQSPPLSIGIDYQALTCLHGQWAVCPRLAAAQKSAQGNAGNGIARHSTSYRRIQWAVTGVVVIAIMLATGFVFIYQTGGLGAAPQPAPPGAAIAQPTRTAAPTETPRPTATASPQPTATVTATRTPAPTTMATRIPSTATPTIRPAPTALAAHVIARVTLPPDYTLNVRDRASTAGKVLAQLKDSATVTIVDGPVEANGLRWWKLDTNQGVTGWSVERLDSDQLLVPVSWAN